MGNRRFRAQPIKAGLLLLTTTGLMLTRAVPNASQEWPAWRGPTGMGISIAGSPPIRWTKTENVRWRVPLPEPGNSTPIVWGNRVFATQAIAAEKRRLVMCFDRATGRLIWRTGVSNVASEPTHPDNPYASSSPVTDGQFVYVWLGAAGVAAYDFDGREVWRRELGAPTHTWGYASSLALHANRLFRRMIRMVRGVNRDMFDGRQLVTCQSCHRGAPGLRRFPGRQSSRPASAAVALSPRPREAVQLANILVHRGVALSSGSIAVWLTTYCSIR